MSALAIGLAFTAGSLILFVFSWFLAMRSDRIAVRGANPPSQAAANPDAPASANDDQVAGLERSRSV